MADSQAYKKIFVASDHAGVDLKKHLLARFPELPWVDLGAESAEPVDYPDFAAKLCVALEPEMQTSCGVLICGSGQGMAIRANRFSFVRAALCWSDEVAELARRHNDANVLCLGSRLLKPAEAESVLRVFLSTSFEGGRHQGRVSKLSC